MKTFRFRLCSRAEALPKIMITQISRWKIVNQSCYPSIIDYITGVVFNTRIIALRYKQMFWYYKPHVIKNNATIRLSGVAPQCIEVGSRSSLASSEFMPYLVNIRTKSKVYFVQSLCNFDKTLEQKEKTTTTNKWKKHAIAEMLPFGPCESWWR